MHVHVCFYSLPLRQVLASFLTCAKSHAQRFDPLSHKALPAMYLSHQAESLPEQSSPREADGSAVVVVDGVVVVVVGEVVDVVVVVDVVGLGVVLSVVVVVVGGLVAGAFVVVVLEH